MYYRDSLTSEVLRLSAVVQPDISRETMESVAKSMSVVQLKEFKNAFEKRADSILPSVPQLYKQKNDITAESNGNFKI